MVDPAVGCFCGYQLNGRAETSTGWKPIRLLWWRLLQYMILSVMILDFNLISLIDMGMGGVGEEGGRGVYGCNGWWGGGWNKNFGSFATPNYIQNSKTYMDCMNWKLM